MGTQISMYKDAYEQQLDAAGEANAKTQLVFEAIAEKENIVVTDADVQEYANNVISAAASSAGATASMDDYKKQFEQVYGSAIDFKSFLRTSCIYDKVVSFISGSMKIKE